MSRATSRWRQVASVPAGVSRARVAGLHRNHRYAFRLRAVRGTVLSTAYSNRVVVRVR